MTIWADLIHLSVNEWGKDTWRAEDGWVSTNRDTICCDDGVWTRVTDRLAQAGGNMALVDVGDAVVCPSHPELAVKGAWSAEKMAAEVKRLKAMGVEAIPKLNFSTTHDHWLRDYGRMIGTPQYYSVVRDLIRDVCDIFGHPRLFHLGLDEELMDQIRGIKGIGTFRRGRAYWYDVRFYADCCEKCGARPWMFCDYIMDYEEEFLANCPKSIVQTAWYYWDKFQDEERNNVWFERMHWKSYEMLEKGRFDQIPCGSTCCTKEKPGYNQFDELVKHVGRVVPKERLLGYLQTSWEYLVPGAAGEDENLKAIAHLEAARRNYEGEGR